MVLTRLDLRTLMQESYKTGFNTQDFEGYVTRAVERAIRDAFPDFPELTYQDIIGDGVSTRYALTGRDIVLRPFSTQDVPATPNSAGITGPTTAPVVTQTTTTGTLAAGTYYVAYAYTNSYGETNISTYTTVLVPAGTSTNKITVSAITLPTGITGINYYFSPAILNPDIRLSGSGTGSSFAITTMPAVTAQTPPATFTTIANMRLDLEPGFDALGRVNPAVTTLSFTTAPALAARYRVSYTRRHEIVTYDTATINLPQDYMEACTHKWLLYDMAANSQSGDAKLYMQLYKEAELQVMDIVGRSGSRRSARWRGVTW